MNRKLIILVLLIVPYVNACSIESTHDSSLPKSWITFHENKYTYENSYTVDEITEFELHPTGEVTGEDHGTGKGLEIHKDLEANSIFVKTETNGLIQWLRYSKVN